VAVGRIKFARHLFSVAGSKNAKYFVISVLGIGLAVGVLSWASPHQTDNNDEQSGVAYKCSSQTLRDASQVFDPTKVADLGRIVVKIQKNNGYTTDPNCLYVVTTYYINLSDSSHARYYVDKLNAAYDKNKGLSASLNPNINLSVADLNDTVKFLEKNDQQFKLNERGSAEP